MSLESRIKQLESRSSGRVVLAFANVGETEDEAIARAMREHGASATDEVIVLRWMERQPSNA
jgi:hypothetical protein